MNMGTMLIIFTFYLVILLIYPFVKFLRHDAKCAAKLLPKLHSMLFWNHTILFIQEGFLDILLAVSVNLYFLNEGTLEWNTFSLVFTNLLSIFMAACCGILFIFIIVYLWPRFDKLGKKRMKRRFLPAYEMLNRRHGQWTLLWPVFFMGRRIIFVIAVCALVDQTVFQIILFMLPTIAVMMLLALVKPLADLPSNRLEIYNSFVILLLIYCLMCFT